MKIDHGTAIILEVTVRNLWNLHDRGHLNGAIDADHFESDPYLSTLLILAPFVLRNPNVEKDEEVGKLCNELYLLECDDKDGSTVEECSKIAEKSRELSDYLKAHFEPAE